MLLYAVHWTDSGSELRETPLLDVDVCKDYVARLKRKTSVTVSVLLAGGVFIVLLVLFFCYYTRRTATTARQQQQQQPRRSSSTTPADAAGGISNGKSPCHCLL